MIKQCNIWSYWIHKGALDVYNLLSNSSLIGGQVIEFDDLDPLRELILPLCQMDKKSLSNE